MAVDLKTFPTQAVTDYADARQHIRSGDLLLCSGSGWIAKIIQRMTDSPWSHAGFLMKLDSIDRVMVLESVETIGVRAVPLSHYMTDYRGQGSPYPGGIVVGRHADFRGAASPAALRRLGRFAVNLLGYPYDGSEIAKIAARIMATAIEFPAGDRKLLRRDREFICSEYIDELFRCVDIKLNHDGRCFISPASIAADPLVSLQAVLKRAI